MKRSRFVLLFGALGLGLLALAFQQGWLGGSGGGRLNVLLISIDSLRRDHLGVYGHRPEYAPGVPVSPNIDALANEGVVFDSAWSSSSWTLPAHSALMTGLSDRSHGVEMDDFRIDPLRETLALKFQQAGYSTGGFFSGPYLDPKYGFGKGFDVYESGMISPEELARAVKRYAGQLEASGQPHGPQVIRSFRDRASHWDRTSERINRKALGFLERQDGGKPFFLFLHYFDVHYDYIPPEGLAKKFDPGYTGKMDGNNWYFRPDVFDRSEGKRKIGERDLGHVRALYDAELNGVDDHIGRIFAALKKKGLWDRTIVMLVADHGDEFFEHGFLGHRSTLFRELTSIPMILRVPGATPPGKRIPELVRIYDAAPTLLDYAGAGPIEDAEGRSLRPLVEGGAWEPRGVISRITHYGFAGSPNIRDAWRNERYTVVRRFLIDGQDDRGRLQVRQAIDGQTRRPFLYVFDRRSDPGEHTALDPADPRFREAMQGFCRDFQAAEAHAAALKHSSLENRYAPDKSQEELTILSQLGYAEDTDLSGRKKLAPLTPFPPPCP